MASTREPLLTDRKRSRSWRAFLVLGALAVAVYPLVPHGPVRDWALFDAIALAASAAIAYAALLHRPRAYGAWLFIAAGQFAFALGDGLFGLEEYVLHSKPFPSIADGFYLSGYPLTALGLTLLTRARAPRRNLVALIDAATITTSLALASWLFLISPIAHDPTLTAPGRVISLAYPLGDVLLLATAARISMGTSGRPPAYWLFGAGIASLLVADSAYLGALQLGDYKTGGVIDLGWLTSYVLLGVAALHPSMRELSLPSAEHLPRLTVSRLGLLAGASLAAPAMLLIQNVRGMPTNIPVFSAFAALLCSLVIARMTLLVRRHEERGARLEEQGAELASELERRSYYDALTGLPNRSFFLERLGEAIGSGGEASYAVVVLGMDDLKLVNEGAGRSAGDELLRAASERLNRLLRYGDLCARLDDGFAVLVGDADVESLTAIGERLVQAFRVSFKLSDEHEATIGVCAGAAAAMPDATAEDVLRNAEVALSRARQLGSGSIEIFKPGMHRVVFERIVLKGQLERALAEQQFLLHYQPIVDLKSGEIWGVEALVRWLHPERGLVAPMEFIPLAEETGLIVPLGEWVLEEAVRQAAIWSLSSTLSVTVNLSGRQLDRPDLVGTVVRALRRSGLPAESLVLEVTETVLMEDVEAALGRLDELRKLGAKIAIDDFGTGYSSLQYLRRMPADIVKVAKPFVDGVGERGNEAFKVVDAIIRLSESFGLRTLAEGIEQPEQRDRLRELDCELGQGFYFSRPQPAEVVSEMLGEAEALAA